jgi:hypothetical protein
MNIVKLQNELKNIPDQALIGYVQNPTGQVPTYLALSELQRRKDMREKFQQQQKPESTVAEDLVAPPAKPQGLAALTQSTAPQESGVAGLPVPDQMFSGKGMAAGGIVAFAGGGSTLDDYGIDMPVVPTYDDLKMENFNAMQQYGVDPEFYAKQAKELQKQREELKGEKTDAGWMALARAGLGMAAGTSPYALKNISEGAVQGVTQYAADIKDIKAQDRLLKQADMKLAEAQNAQNRGDAQGALKSMEERKNTLLNAQLKRAEILSKDAIARAKATGDKDKLESAIKIQAAKIGEQKFINAYPSGSVSGYLGDNQALTQFIRNRFIKDTENYLRNGTEAPIPSEQSLIKEFEALYPKSKPASGKPDNKPAAKPASKVSGPDSALNIPRPANIQKIIDKHAANANKRYNTTNTDEELNTNWDLAGQGLDDPYYQD